MTVSLSVERVCVGECVSERFQVGVLFLMLRLMLGWDCNHTKSLARCGVVVKVEVDGRPI